ncbi:MAG: DsbE family thiol:disulfide interchange protein [Gammaproteobacteria bacterium]|nr:DsbE family thiol:disulfide interchange protein [Gammaproteobacteria bacterium]
MKPRHLIPLGLFLLLTILLGVGLTLDPREVPSPFIGKPAPTFDLPQLHDNALNLTPEEMKGQVWLLNVWASWCVSCRAEHKVITSLANTKEVNIVGLNYKDQREDALLWLKQFGNPYLASVSDLKGRTGIDYGVYGVPETFVIDQQGIIRYKQIGPVTREAVAEKILPLIRELKAKAS